ncbi:MAG: DUF1109 domain-containing protein [Deltaproteobacteria bacterium]|nr:MAG: DUF1109 domain-containing protein [Deltaproteobacteria bacterium]
MTAARSTEAIVARLARDLAPVRPIAPLHRQAIAIAGAWAASAAVAAGWIGLHPLVALARGAISASLLVALAVIGAAGLVLGLACRVPGRERLALAAAIGAGFGAIALAAVGFSLPGPIADTATVVQGEACSERSLVLAIPSALLAASLGLRGAPWRPRIAGIGLAVGAAALGGLLVHASCPSPSPAHWLTSHALLPLAVGAAAGWLVARYFDRRAQSARQTLVRALNAELL